MGTGKTSNIPKEEALMSKAIRQSEFDMLLTNLRMDAAFVKGMFVLEIIFACVEIQPRKIPILLLKTPTRRFL